MITVSVCLFARQNFLLFLYRAGFMFLVKSPFLGPSPWVTHSMATAFFKHVTLSQTYLSYIATRCLRVCLLAAYLLRNGWTDLAKLFFVSSVLVTGWFQAKKFRIRDLVFPMIRKTRFWREIINYFCKKYLNFHVENRRNNTQRLYRSSKILSSEEKGQSHFQTRRRGAAPAPRQRLQPLEARGEATIMYN